MSYVDKTELSYWLPILETAGIPVPKTIVLDMPTAAQECVWNALDGVEINIGDFEAFATRVRNAASTIGYPCFLRTDHTSGKHSWKKTCFLSAPEDAISHIFALVETSECSGIGLTYANWAVREFLPTIPIGVCPKYGDMPICKEFRFFVDEGEVVCWHPYWPREALMEGGAPDGLDYADLCDLTDEAEVASIASRAGKALGGAWSIDILQTRRGWFVTDLAEAHKSFHWDGCPHVFVADVKT